MFPRELAPGDYDRVVAAFEQHGFQPEIRAFSDPPPQAMVARLRTTREVGIPPASFAYHTAAADPDLVARKIVEPEIMIEWSILWPGARPIGGDGSFPGERAPLCWGEGLAGRVRGRQLAQYQAAVDRQRLTGHRGRIVADRRSVVGASDRQEGQGSAGWPPRPSGGRSSAN